jgi:hypothetical protein
LLHRQHVDQFVIPRAQPKLLAVLRYHVRILERSMQPTQRVSLQGGGWYPGSIVAKRRRGDRSQASSNACLSQCSSEKKEPAFDAYAPKAGALWWQVDSMWLLRRTAVKMTATIRECVLRLKFNPL